MLGMYVHMHWSYKHPYAARTWTPDDWRSYLQGLRSLGYDFLMIWPMLDSMPPDPNASDLAFLEKIGGVIRMAQNDMGMKVGIVSCPNTIGNEKSSAYAFEDRPYFACERKLDPADRASVELLVAGRRRQFRPISRADALVVIDSDPGGWIGSTSDEFVALMAAQAGAFRGLNPRAEIVYWMLFGWECYNRFWAEADRWKPGDPPPRVQMNTETFSTTLAQMRKHIAEPWRVFASWNHHLEATEALGLVSKRWYFPYGLIEGEPTFPLTNCDPGLIAERMKPYTPAAFPCGFMANAQSHALQLPHTYLVSHYALKGPSVAPDLAAFAEQLMPRCGAKIAEAWAAIAAADPQRQRVCARDIRAEVGRPHAAGPASGLLFGSPDRFLTDLAMNLDVRAGMAELKAAMDSSADPRPAMRRLLADLRPWQERLGFVDAYGGPLVAGLNQQVARLNDPKIAAVLQQFHDWRNPAIRHGILPRLLDAVEAYAKAG